ncbi:TIR domain-containing protein [Streptomyces sp. Amel2xB2]|uniref:toll/interleukin-1 receptor domain-containing protein n=1 Tax=Streptomyces sp. Amel2xB2 TaxID=1305829 RepID=UPI000DBABD62|nr:toll/interleukin-1 receptor domain-containing protein [Streptomyces sp. Amel2xB2]RAJ71912.1 TIR domain-containing protein [Streptomyces sp. Amel2xB2]
MARPKIFISHSSGKCGDEGCECAAYRDALAAHLEGLGCDTVVDRDVLRGGDEWHKKLMVELLRSQGAVVLLSRHALDSYHVMEEALLANALREANQQRFLLLPVVLPGVRRADLKGSRLDGIDLGRLDMVDWSPAAGPAVPPPEVAGILRPLVERHGALPHPRVTEYVASRIEGLSDHALRQVAQELGVDVIAYARDHTNYVVSTGLLSERPVDGIGAYCAMRKALTRLLPLLTDREHRRDVVDVVVPFARVPGRAAEQLRTLSDTVPSGRIALLEARKVRTAQMYVRRASEDPQPWRCHIAVPSPELDFVDSLVEDVGDYLAEHLCYGFHDKDVLRRALAQAEDERGGPVTILLNVRPDDELVRRLLAEFPQLLFLFAHDQVDAGAGAGAAGHALLEPLSWEPEMDMLRTHEEFSR